MSRPDATCGIADELELLNREFPIMEHLSAHLKRSSILAGITIGWHCHLTRLTALAVRALVSAGAAVHLSECNSSTTDDSVGHMRALGAIVHLGAESCASVLHEQPLVVSDTGGVLILQAAKVGGAGIYGACEITTSGIKALRDDGKVPFPIINVNDGILKSQIENFHGVGDGLVGALKKIKGSPPCDRAVAVIGYGRVGAGCAEYLRRAGARVAIVESDPIRRLTAHFDGFAIKELPEAIAQSEIVVTATGQTAVIGEKLWRLAPDGCCVMNVGHWSAELDLPALRAISSKSSSISPLLEEFVLDDQRGKRKIFVACQGNPVNVVLLTGSPVPTLIHLATEILCLEFLIRNYKENKHLPAGEMPVPPAVEQLASDMALRALGIGS